MRIILAFGLCLLLVACGGGKSSDLKPISDSRKSQNVGNFKVGKPYKVMGKWYTPQESYDFVETGIASWYGPQFHGKPTANGEIFDMYELTAAHRTLQMPSLVRVTNLENGKSLIVRINDRGPFKRGRVIDLSKKAAELLGFIEQGTAKVRLQVLSEESQKIAQAAKAGRDVRGVEVAMNEKPQGQRRTAAPVVLASTNQGLTAEELRADVPGHIKQGKFLPDPVVQQTAVTPTYIYVQAGSFTNPENASRLAGKLRDFATARVYPATVNGQQFYRVRLGPVANVDMADRILNSMIDAGQNQAIIIVE